MHPTSWSAGAWARIYRRSAQHGVRCCPVAKLARFAVQLSHQMPQLKPVFMVSVSRVSVRNSCCARGHDKMDTLLRSPDHTACNLLCIINVLHVSAMLGCHQ